MILNLKGTISANPKISAKVNANPSIHAKILRGGGDDLTDKPSINGVVIEGDLNGHDYGLANYPDDIPTIPVYNLVKTRLWYYDTDNSGNIAYNTGTYTLHDNINNYDIIVLELASYSGDMSEGNAWNGSAYITLFPHLLNNGYYPNRINICTFASRSTNWEIKNDYVSKRIDNEGSTNGLISVWGIKLGAIV